MNKEFVNAYVRAIETKAAGLIAPFLSEAIRFRSPMIQVVGKEEYLEKLHGFLSWVDRVQVRGVYPGEEGVVVIYDAEFEKMEPCRTAAEVRFEDGEIVSIELFFDPTPFQEQAVFKGVIETTLGKMVAVADEERLYSLLFSNEKIEEGEESAPIRQIREELDLYFKGELTRFEIPIALEGTPFQVAVWESLLKIPYGETWSYRELAASIGKPRACRAVGTANGANKLPIIVPCHRVIASDGKLGGYACGLERKQNLLALEQGRCANRF